VERDEREAVIKEVMKRPLERDLQTMVVVEQGSKMKVVSAEFVMCNDVARLDRFSLLNTELDTPMTQTIIHLGLPTPTDYS
jgi:hypothetical protein